jgi:hypothetical protein
MKRRDCLAAYQDYSRQVSANVRQLGFAAIAVIWLFKFSTEEKAVALPALLAWGGGLFIAALFFDFLSPLPRWDRHMGMASSIERASRSVTGRRLQSSSLDQLDYDDRLHS